MPLGLLLAVGLFGCVDDPNLTTTYDLCVTPEEVVFGPTTFRTSQTRTLSVVNCGNIPMDGVTATLVAPEDEPDADLTPFHVVETTAPTPFQAGASFLLPVAFRPTEARTYNAVLELALLESPTEILAALPATGSGIPPDVCALTIGPAAIDFPATEVGETSAPQTLTLTNQGSGACTIDDVRILEGHEHFAIVDDALAEVAPEASVEVEVVFAPNAPGALTGIASVVAERALELTAALTGEALPSERCRLALDPEPLSFPRASVGFSETTAAAVLENIGELPCTLSATEVSTLSTDFVLATPPANGTLAPGAAVDVEVRFAPTETGAREGVLTFTTDEEGGYDVPLVGFADPSPTCGLLFEPSPVSFPPRAVGLTEQVDITITNASEVPCEVTGSGLSSSSAPEFTLVTSAPAASLQPGQSVGATISYTPIAAAPSTGELVVALDGGATGGGTDVELDLLGFGDYAEVVLTPGTRYFGTVTEGCVSPVYEALLTNVGAVAARLDATGFSMTSDPNFELLTPIAPMTLLGAGESIDLALRMAGAPSPGSHAGSFQVFTTGTVEPLSRAALYGLTASVDEADRTDVFTQRDVPQLDILFVIDNSGSMQHEQQNLAQNFNAFIQFTANLDVDYHIGVVTTDTDGSDAGELVGPYIANVGPDASPDPVGDFVNQVDVGTNGSATEKGLEAAVLAVTEPNVSGANAGFLRPGALLSVIFVSDENDYSPGDVGDYIDELVAAKGYDSAAVTASAVAGEPPAGCSGGGNDASSGDRYYDVTLALEGLFASICTPDWSTTMEELGVGTFSALTRFTLSRVPDSATITVTVDGAPVDPDDLNGWTFDEVNNAISFNGTSVPEPGEVVEISYIAECLTP